MKYPVKMIKRHLHGRDDVICNKCDSVIAEGSKGIELELPYCGSCNMIIEDCTHKYCGWCGNEIGWGECEG